MKSIAIGRFDGVHLAHKELFKYLIKPAEVLVISNGDTLTPINRQEYIDFPIRILKLEDIKNLDDKEFCDLLNRLYPSLENIVIGYDFRFGKDRKYSIDDLKKCFNVIVVDEFILDGVSVHSSYIKKLLLDGNIKRANFFLGHNYKIIGYKISGQGIGKKELVPTINLKVEKFLLPKGVFITKTKIDNKFFNSLTFIGNRTTDNNFSVESYILDYEIDVEGVVEIEFLDKIRDNKKLNLKDLKKQIEKDILIAKRYFLENRD